MRRIRPGPRATAVSPCRSASRVSILPFEPIDRRAALKTAPCPVSSRRISYRSSPERWPTLFVRQSLSLSKTVSKQIVTPHNDKTKNRMAQSDRPDRPFGRRITSPMTSHEFWEPPGPCVDRAPRSAGGASVEQVLHGNGRQWLSSRNATQKLHGPGGRTG